MAARYILDMVGMGGAGDDTKTCFLSVRRRASHDGLEFWDDMILNSVLLRVYDRFVSARDRRTENKLLLY